MVESSRFVLFLDMEFANPPRSSKGFLSLRGVWSTIAFCLTLDIDVDHVHVDVLVRIVIWGAWLLLLGKKSLVGKMVVGI